MGRLLSNRSIKVRYPFVLPAGALYANDMCSVQVVGINVFDSNSALNDGGEKRLVIKLIYKYVLMIHIV